jgi:hypothetical protein
VGEGIALNVAVEGSGSRTAEGTGFRDGRVRSVWLVPEQRAGRVSGCLICVTLDCLFLLNSNVCFFLILPELWSEHINSHLHNCIY